MIKNMIRVACLVLTLCLPLSVASQGAVDGLSINDGRSTITVIDLKRELLSLPKANREAVIVDKRRLARFVENILSNRRAMEAAKQTEIPNSPEVYAETEKARRDAIARIYIEKLLEKAEAELPAADKYLSLARERYAANINDYLVSESVRVAHILFKIDVEKAAPTEAEVRAKAEEVLVALRNGADFSKLAEQHSEDAGSSRRGGELSGFVTKGKMVPPFERVAFELDVGELSGLVRTRFGYHIIKVLERRQAGKRPFEEVSGEIVKQLRDQQMATLRSQIMQPINGTQEVVIDDAFLEALKR